MKYTSLSGTPTDRTKSQFMSVEPTTQEAELLDALARGEAIPDDRRRAVDLLVGSESLRAHYRMITDGKFPPIPNYTIIDQVGKGGFGVVYRAIHHATERIEALKVLFSKTPLLTSYFENEVHLIARLRHPNIATLYDAQLSTPPLYYSMDFVEGQRLNDYLRGQGVSLADRIQIVLKVALAIDYAHAQGVIHRDIKPQNILIDAASEPHIVDFGIARRLRLDAPPRMTESGTPEGPVGTLGYIAPEVVAGQRIDGRVDVFALGALLFHCVTMEPARLARDPQQRMMLLRQRRVAHVDDLGAIIAKCVETQPDKRYPTCAAFAADLENFLAGRPVDARREPSPAHYLARLAALLVRNHPYEVRGLAALTAALVVALLFGAMRVNSAPSGEATERDVALVTFTDNTVRAIEEGRLGADIPGVNDLDNESWRALHGRFMEIVAAAGPRVVTWDYYFANDNEEFDPAFVRGVESLTAVGVPVVVGVRDFDLNSEPRISAAIRAAVHSSASIVSVNADYLPRQFEVVYAFRRGYEPPVPALALAAYAASRFPECRPEYEFKPDRKSIRITYRRPAVTEGQSRFAPESDELPVFTFHTVNAAQAGDRPGVILEGDQMAHTRVAAEPESAWLARAIPYEAVFTADLRLLRTWFANKVVLIGEQRPGVDMHKIWGGAEISGCMIQAQALKALLENSPATLPSRSLLFLTCLMWTIAAGVYVSVTRARQWDRLTRVTAVCLSLTLVGLLVPILIGAFLIEAWLIQLAVCLSSLLVGGGTMYLLKAVRERQIQLAPATVPVADETEALQSTMLANRAQ